jgi:OOP family OmpA-OmpF porin
MRKIFTGVAVLLLSAAAHAQFTYDYLKAADNYFSNAKYASAAEYYEKYLTGGKSKNGRDVYNPYVVQGSSKKSVATQSSRPEAIYKLAESYRHLNYPAKAEPNYRFLVETEPARFPLARYHHATSLRALEKFAEAEQAFNAFLDQYKTADAYTDAAKREIQNLRFIQQQLKKKDLNLYQVAKSSGDLNTTGGSYAPALLNGNLYFTSTRPDSSAGKNETYVNRVYQVDASGAVQRVNLREEPGMHQGAATFTPDGNTMYFTRWKTGLTKTTAGIYMSRREGNGWSNPQLVMSVNTAGSNSKQPFVMPGGRQLLFASDRGGEGGFDLWMSSLDAQGIPGDPVNLGKTINTAADEEAPYYHEPSGTLVFATNGRVGMGGFDLFQSKGQPGSWSEPENMGYPVNYVKDDIYFTSRGGARNILEDVLFSTDRAAACCLEMFSLKKTIPLRQVNGLVVACETNSPLAGATINIVDTVTNTTVYTKTTGADGSYSFTLEEFRPLKAMAAAEGYHSNTLHFSRPSDQESLSLGNPALCLTAIPKAGTVEVLENVYYAFNKAQLLEESFAALDKLAELMNQNPNMRIEIGGHTDDVGNDAYNQKLSDARAKSVVDYLVNNKGIDKGRIESKGYGETMPVAPNRNADGSDNPEGRKKNRRTEFKVLSN